MFGDEDLSILVGPFQGPCVMGPFSPDCIRGKANMPLSGTGGHLDKMKMGLNISSGDEGEGGYRFL
jgi:hypothetical protein